MKIIAALALVAVLLGGCALFPGSKTLAEVDVQLKWLHQSQFAGNYVAADKGFYEEEGIKIRHLKPFTFKDFPIASVQSGKAHFAITGADELIVERAAGRAPDVVAVAVIYRKNPVALYSLARNNITRPADLQGKTVGIERAEDGTEVNVGILYKAMLAKAGLDASRINDITIGYDATELLNGTTDVSSGYIINEPYQVIEMGLDVNTMLLADFGANMYADLIITHRDIINQRPDLVRGFVSATLEGWRWARDHHDETLDIVRLYSTDHTRAHESYMLTETIPLIFTGDEPAGRMKAGDWEQAARILLDQRIIEKPVDVSDLYTNQFIP